VKVLSHRTINLHSASAPGGLVHILAKIPKTVPNDVENEPGFDMLVSDGILAILRDSEQDSDKPVRKNEASVVDNSITPKDEISDSASDSTNVDDSDDSEDEDGDSEVAGNADQLVK
jgi:hypothetical protein